MANIETSNKSSRRVDQELPLVPFIDLLFCCVMFLLATAVYNDLGEVSVQNPQPSEEGVASEDPTLMVLVGRETLAVAAEAGDRQEMPMDATQESALNEALRARLTLQASRSLTVIADDDVPYARVVQVMDTARGAGFELQLRGTD